VDHCSSNPISAGESRKNLFFNVLNANGAKTLKGAAIGSGRGKS
jgi:hypothetical protein